MEQLPHDPPTSIKEVFERAKALIIRYGWTTGMYVEYDEKIRCEICGFCITGALMYAIDPKAISPIDLRNRTRNTPQIELFNACLNVMQLTLSASLKPGTNIAGWNDEQLSVEPIIALLDTAISVTG